MWKYLAFIACGLLAAACLPVVAQDEPADDDSGASTRSADEVQREALRALMGDDQESRSSSGTASGSSRSGSGAGASGRATTPDDSDTTDARTGSRTRPSDREATDRDRDEPEPRSSSTSRRTGGRPRDEAPSSGSVPVVPATPSLPDTPATPDATGAPTTPSPYATDPYPAESFGTDGQAVDPAAGLPPEAAVTDNALGTLNAVDQEAGGARSGSAIIIGLIILAVLLVALAAVVGVMAAHRSHPAEVAATDAVPGWAYFTAPNAPNIGLQKTPFLMGSSQQSDLVLADPKASPEHARVDHTAEGYVLTDLNSLNGTYLNGQRIASPVVLRPGDEVRMGDIAVKFEVYS